MKTKSKVLLITFALFILLLSACQPNQTAKEPSPQPTSIPATEVVEPTALPTALPTDHLVISEVMMGATGMNNHDFIELYNPTQEIVDLKGLSLWYQLKADKEPTLVLRWNQSTLIPPYGHYLIVREGEDFGLAPDAWMTTSLVQGKGSLLLAQGQQTIIDQLAWGSTEQILSENTPATSPEQGQSIERLPADENGNYLDTQNNLTDFLVQSNPNPQNVGSLPVPSLAQPLQVSVTAPTTVEPGQNFDYQFTFLNNSEVEIAPEDVTLHITFPELLQTEDTIGVQSYAALTSALAPGESQTLVIPNTTPWTYATLALENTYVSITDNPYPIFTERIVTEIEGGKVPIGTARDLIGSELTVEGKVTMYPDGFYAGSGAKFYIEDETGGIQVYVSGAADSLALSIGMTVRIQGVVTVYNEALELIPASEGQIEVIAPVDKDNLPQPKQLEIFETTQNRSNYLGQLIQVQGRIARAEEFSYSYEIDILDEFGNILTAYLDKDTGVNIEFLESGKYYKLTGILEVNSSSLYLYPRLFADFEEIFPEALLIEANPPEMLAADGTAQMSFTIYNHTHQTVDDITVRLPINHTFTVAEPQQAQINGDYLEWTIPSMEGNGTSLTLSFTLTGTPEENFVDIRGYEVEVPDMLRGTNVPVYIFKQNETPIWAIQGEDNRSPYTTLTVTTSGIVTGVFPDLGGFYIQNLTPDQNDLTSEGLFIAMVDEPNFIDLNIGDIVSVTGAVSEGYQETKIKIADFSAVNLLDTDQDLPMPVSLDPPQDSEAALDYYESLEGMLVMIDQPAIAISSVNKYGETFAILEKNDVTRIMQGEPSGYLLCIDDGVSLTFNNLDEIEYPITQGSVINQVVGPLAYAYNIFMVEPILPIQIDYADLPLPTFTPTTDGQIRIMTWNVENLFDFTEPTVSSPPTPSFGEYKTSVQKVANTILAAGLPDIVAVQEVENIEILQDIAETDTLSPYNYQPLLLEGFDSRLIDVGYLVREDNLTILDLAQHTPPDGLMSRPTLALTVELADGQKITLLNNHFLSMSGGEEATEPRRDAQAAWNVSVIQELSQLDPEMQFIVMGDLNSYYDAEPINTLREAGLIHVMQDLTPQERYTYVYLGQSQVLDHILVSPSLWDQAVSVDILHTNADFPLAPEDDTSAQRKSDHDPVTVTIELTK
jgi:predicted extracellular nuclease